MSRRAHAPRDRADDTVLDQDVGRKDVGRAPYDGTDCSFSLQVWTVSPASTRTISMQSITGHTIWHRLQPTQCSSSTTGAKRGSAGRSMHWCAAASHAM